MGYPNNGGRRGPPEEDNDMLTGGMIDAEVLEGPSSERDAASFVCTTVLTDWRSASIEIMEGELLDTRVRDEGGCVLSVVVEVPEFMSTVVVTGLEVVLVELSVAIC